MTPKDPPTADSSLLLVQSVSKTYRTYGEPVHALQAVDLRVDRGQVVGVVGESGSGKSTLARIVVGLEEPDLGEVLLEGVAVGKHRSRAQRRLVQIVFQDPRSSLNPRMSIYRSIEDFAIVHRIGTRQERRRAVEDALTMVHLSVKLASRRPNELSGGQLQRACLARALVVRPDLLVADEPTSSLDVSIQGQILNLLDELRDRLSILLISHDMAVIRYLSNEVYVMFQGRVVENGSTDQVIHNPRNDYSRDLLVASFRWERERA